ncbi:MAG: P1 family peptidase [Anaerolineae bacterium]
MSFDVPGIKVGHATIEQFHTGCTVFLCPDGAVGSVDVRGPGPGTRDTVLLSPDRPLHEVNAVVLTGGSAFGLATADGVVRYLTEQGIGHVTPIRPVPIVTAAVVYDLFLSRGERMPDADLGYAACLDAREDNSLQGNVGAGAGVTIGKWAGPGYFMKGGFGVARIAADDLIVAAAAVVNCIGDVVAADGSVLAGARESSEGSDEFQWVAGRHPLRYVPYSPLPGLGTNTTLILVATNAKLDKVEAYRLAQRAHDGLAIAVRPAHMTHDGDTAFTLATGMVEAPFELTANAAVEVVAEAIRNGVRHAKTVADIPGLAG